MSTTRAEPVRCVMLAPPERAVSRAIEGEINARGWHVLRRSDPLVALADLAVREKSQRGRVAWGLPRAEQLAVLILEPARWPTIGSFERAVRYYFPSVAVWHAVGDRLECRHEPRNDQPRAPGRSVATRTSRPADDAAAATRDEDVRDASHSSKTTISRDELNMLLEIEMGEESP